MEPRSARAEARGLNAAAFLANNDSYRFLDALGDLIRDWADRNQRRRRATDLGALTVYWCSTFNGGFGGLGGFGELGDFGASGATGISGTASSVLALRTLRDPRAV